MAWTLLKPEPYDPDAQDGDGDGIVQENTAWERPVGARLLLPSGLEVTRGESSLSRPPGVRVVDPNGNPVAYVPSYEKPDLTSSRSRSALADVGAPSLREMGFIQLRDSQGTLGSPLKDDVRNVRTTTAPTPGYQRLSEEEMQELFAQLGIEQNWVDFEPEFDNLSDGYKARVEDLKLRTGIEQGNEDPLPDGPEKEFGDALNAYLHEEDVWFINQGLRTGEWPSEEYKRKADVLIEQIAKEQGLPVPLVFRGLSDADFAMSLKPGDTFTDDGFVSTTEVPNSAAYFAGQGQNSVLLVIEPTDATRETGVFVGRNDEGEWILPPGSTFEVGEVKETVGEYGVTRVIKLRWTGVKKPAKQDTAAPEVPTAKLLNRDWQDFSDLSNDDLYALRGNLDQAIQDAEDIGDQTRVRDLRRHFRLLVDEGRFRMAEQSRLNDVRQQQEVADLWAREFRRFGAWDASFSQWDDDGLADVLDAVAEMRDRLEQEKNWDVDEAIRYGERIDELESVRAAAAAETLQRQIDGVAATRLKQRWDELDAAVRVGLNDRTADQVNGLLIEADGLARDARRFDRDGVTEVADIRKDVAKTREFLRRRLMLGDHKRTEPAVTAGLNPAVAGITPRAVDVRRPTVTEVRPGDVLPTVRQFGVNEDGSLKFTNVEEAAAFVADGGSLTDVPNRFWGQVLARNASSRIDDPTTKFYVKPGEGAVAETEIYLLRNPDGTLGNQGYVVKTSTQSDGIGEMLGFNLAVAHGVNTEGASWDGVDEQSRPAVVLPHAFNLAPDGQIETPMYSDYDHELFNDLPDRAMPQVLSHFLHNYLLGVTDRHGGNGKMMLVGDQPVIVPLDQGWAAKGRFYDDPLEDFQAYANEFSMHPDLLNDFSRYPDEMPDDYWDRIDAVYDDMVTRAEAVVREGERGWRQMVPYDPDNEGLERDFIDKRIEQVFSLYQKRVDHLKNSREAILQRLRISDEDTSLSDQALLDAQQRQAEIILDGQQRAARNVAAREDVL